MTYMRVLYQRVQRTLACEKDLDGILRPLVEFKHL